MSRSTSTTVEADAVAPPLLYAPPAQRRRLALQPGRAPASRPMITRLTPHFSLEELTATSHRGIDNTPDRAALAALRLTAQRMETVRAILGDEVIVVTSGFRCKALNRKVGGSATSAHLTGYAVDFNCYGFGTPYQVCKALEGRIAYDQLIHEFGQWVHIGFGPGQRGQALTARRQGGRTVYLAGIQRL